MGSWFSNIHIRKSGTATAEAAQEWFRRYLEEQGYQRAAAEDSDGALAVLEGEGWTTVCSDLFSLENPDDFQKLAEPISEGLQTDVLGIACFDSDYLYLNLINRPEKVNAWLGIGSAAGLGIKRRTGLAAWKKKVRDFEAFSACAKQKYICAEEFLFDAADCLGLSAEHSGVSYEYLPEFGLEKTARILYFKLPEDQKPKELPCLTQWTSSLDPCWLDVPHGVDVINVGGESRGLSVFFIGPYVEQEEITFTDLWLYTGKDEKPWKKSIELTKVQLSDGQWAYYYHDPGFRIPPKVDDLLPWNKRLRMTMEREITVRFIPHGNPRKVLDITVVFVPDKNPEGQIGWNVWNYSGSKDAFIAETNEREMRFWERFPPEKRRPKLLRREDFD